MIAPAGWLAQNQPPPAQGPEFGGASPIALVVTLVLLVALIFLMRSMNKHLRKVPKSFDPPEQSSPSPSPSPATDTTDTADRSEAE